MTPATELANKQVLQTKSNGQTRISHFHTDRIVTQPAIGHVDR